MEKGSLATIMARSKIECQAHKTVVLTADFIFGFFHFYLVSRPLLGNWNNHHQSQNMFLMHNSAFQSTGGLLASWTIFGRAATRRDAKRVIIQVISTRNTFFPQLLRSFMTSRKERIAALAPCVFFHDHCVVEISTIRYHNHKNPEHISARSRLFAP